MAQISTNAEFIQVNTTTNPGTIVLPSANTIPGRVLTFKDITGTFFTNRLTLSTSGTDLFQNGANLKQLVEPFGYLTLASDGINRWFELDGTSLNTYTINSLTNPMRMSTTNISSSAFSVSTFGFVDQSFATLSTMYTRSTLLYLGSNVIGGSKAGPTQFMRPPGQFQPNQISGITLWLDASDPSSLQSSGNNLLLWRDKSGLANNATSPTGSILINQGLINGLQTVQFNTNSGFNFTINYTNNYRALFYVTRLGAQGGASFNYIIMGGGTTGISLQSYSFNGNLEFNRNGLQIYVTNTPSPFFNTTSITSATNSTQSGAPGLYINGNIQSFVTSNVATFLTGAGNVTLGGEAARATLSYLMGELIIIENNITQLQRQQVEGYLAWKWGLVGNLPATHPYKSSPP